MRAARHGPHSPHHGNEITTGSVCLRVPVSTPLPTTSLMRVPQASRNSASVGPARVRVADVGRKEFEKKHTRALAGGGDKCRHSHRPQRKVPAAVPGRGPLHRSHSGADRHRLRIPHRGFKMVFTAKDPLVLGPPLTPQRHGQCRHQVDEPAGGECRHHQTGGRAKLRARQPVQGLPGRGGRDVDTPEQRAAEEFLTTERGGRPAECRLDHYWQPTRSSFTPA